MLRWPAGHGWCDLPTPDLFLIAALRGEQVGGIPRKAVLLVLAGGVFFGLDIASWHVGIGDTRLANAVLFGNAGSVILMVWGFVMLRRLPIGREWQAIVAALTGSAILLGRSLELSTANFVGDLFCLLAGLLYAGYLLLLQDARKSFGSWSVLAVSSSASVAVLFVVAQLAGEPFWPTDWTPVLVLAFSSQLLVYSLKAFPPLAIGIALLTQPAVAALIGWLAFGELLVPLDLLGVGLVGSALVLARVTGPREPPRPRVNPV